MSREKQIEEMAKDLQKSEHWYFNDHSVDFELDRKKTAENLYNAGYRKRSENVIELPCKAGDTVWWADTEFEELLKGEVVSFSLQKEGLWAYCLYKGGLTYWHLVSNYFGKAVFLTREEAEHKMKGGE